MMSMKLITSKKLTELSKEALRLEIDLVLDELLSAEGSQLFTLRAKTYPMHFGTNGLGGMIVLLHG